MRKLSALFLVLLILASCDRSRPKGRSVSVSSSKDTLPAKAPAKVDEALFKDLRDTTLLGRLFDNPRLDTTGAAVWKPNYYERMTYRVSYDGRCHTNIDTVMYFTDHEKRRCACVILTTYNYRKGTFKDSTTVEIWDCHFCGVPIGIVLLAQQPDSAWKLYRFEKAFTTLGWFGTYRTGLQDAGTVALKRIGDPWTCLSLKQGVGGNGGESTGTEHLYSIEQFQMSGYPNDVLTEVLAYDFYHEEEIYGDTSVLGTKEERTEMKLIPRPNDYSDLDLVTNANGRLRTAHYSYSDKQGQYARHK